MARTINFNDEHVFAQIGPLRHCGGDAAGGGARGAAPPLDFVGALEHFERDWAALGALGGFARFPFDPKLGQHEWPLHAANHGAMSALLANASDARYLRALCAVLAPDFARQGARVARCAVRDGCAGGRKKEIPRTTI